MFAYFSDRSLWVLVLVYGDLSLILANTRTLLPLSLAINFAEAYRASKGWVEPGSQLLFRLRKSCYPGDLGFDPLGLKPTVASEFAEMQDGELNNGCLAMLDVASMYVQEQINGQGILENLGF